MNPRWRMLLWEQGRTAGVLCLAFCGVSLLFSSVQHITLFYRYIFPQDATGASKILEFVVPAVAALVLTARQDGRGHISWDYEPRMLRLPVKTSVLFTAVIGTRILCLVALLLFNRLLTLTFPESSFNLPPVYLLLPFYFFLVVQSLLWSHRRAPVITESIVVFTVGILLLHRFTGGSKDLEEWLLVIGNQNVIEWLLSKVTHPVALVAVPPASIALMAFGVYLQRRDEYFGPPKITEILGRANQTFSLSVDTARSPLEAQLWYENRRIGRLLPVLTLFVTGFLVMLSLVVAGNDVFRSGFTQYLPLIALPIAALIAGVRSRSIRSQYAYLRPVAAHHLATAQCLAHLRTLLCAIPFVVFLFFLFMLADIEERGILATAWQEGYADVVDVIVYCMRPLAVSLFVAWIMLWVITGLGAMVAATLFLILPVNIFYYLQARGGHYEYFTGSFYNVIGILIITALAATLFSLYRKKIPLQKFFAQILCCLMIAILVRFGSREMDGTAGLLIALTCGIVCVLPLTAMTWTIEKKRHAVKR